MVQHVEIKIEKSRFSHVSELIHLIKNEVNGELLRWFVNKVSPKYVIVEASVIKEDRSVLKSNTSDKTFIPGKQVLVSLVPTGIGCSIGGFAADAAPATTLLASQVDYLVTNPNAVNASNFINIRSNILYTEGYMIDRFMQGESNLYPVNKNKVGVIIEHTTTHNLDVVFNIINTARAVYGIDIVACHVTREKIGTVCQKTNTGTYVGDIRSEQVLFEACDYLVARGCTAIAVTSNFDELPNDDYALHFQGNHPNPVGGAEAIISHAIVRRYSVPCAHAPMINLKDLALETNIVDARGAGEWASESGLACVLIGMAKAPSPLPMAGNARDVVNVKNVLAVVTPATALGSVPVFSAIKLGIPVIAVRDNKTILDVTRDALNLTSVIEVSNYFEASGVVQAIKEGISLESVTRPLTTMSHNMKLKSEYSLNVYE